MSTLIRQKLTAWQDECVRTQRLQATHLLLAATALSTVLVMIVQAAIWIAA
ncbi:hypothetical protein [Paracoccus aestuariivivens]|uniref:Uncharacterized protein n=1 Tax=Paracoccus aestuariivivens TaxID=1820333 RepID=A0A6L6JGD8_9RHOB|nr:hypothetical protein [Paracoccus aestuariivivens]MTH80268.1 hypothetical protein [Paracoccus aestuariivivens]